jgi:hypothetical protein
MVVSGIGGKRSIRFGEVLASSSRDATRTLLTATGVKIGTPFSVLMVLDAAEPPELLSNNQRTFEGANLTGFDPVNAVVATNTTEQAASGSRSLKLVNNGTGVGDSFLPLAGQYTMSLGMQGGRTYRISGKIRSTQLATSAPDGRAAKIVLYHRVGGVYGGGQSAAPTVVNTWTSVSFDVTIPVGATEAFIRLYNGWNNGTATVFYDDLSVLDITGYATPYSRTSTTDWSVAAATWWATSSGVDNYLVAQDAALAANTKTSVWYAPVGWMFNDGASHSVVHQSDSTHAGHVAYKDGALIARTTYDATYSANQGGSVTTGTFWVGGLTNQDNTVYKGRIAEIVLVPRALTAQERAAWGAYVFRKYGITVADFTPDAASRQATLVRTTGDAASAVDVATSRVTVSRAVADSAVTTEVATRTTALTRTTGDAAPATDTLYLTTGAAFWLDDSAAAIDVASGFTSLVRSTTDTAAASDSLARLASLARTATDAAPASDVAQRSAQTVTRDASDAAVAVDVATRGTTSARSATDTADASDTLTRTLAEARSVVDTAEAVDALARTVSITRSVDDTAGAVDVATRSSQAQVRTTTDTALASDDVARFVQMARTTGDLAVAIDVAAVTQANVRNLDDTALAVDSLSRSVGLTRSVSDLAPALDVVTGRTTTSRTTADAATAIDASVRQVSLTRSQTDAASALDSVASSTSSDRSTSDSALAVDDAVRAIARYRSVADDAPADDAAVRALAAQGRTFDSALGVDVGRGTSTASRATFDAANGYDTIHMGASVWAFFLNDSAPAVDVATPAHVFLAYAYDSAAAVDNALRHAHLYRRTRDRAGAIDEFVTPTPVQIVDFEFGPLGLSWSFDLDDTPWTFVVVDTGWRFEMQDPGPEAASLALSMDSGEIALT